MVHRDELTDQEWELLAPLIPRAATGRPRVEDRQVINGMVYKIRTVIFGVIFPDQVYSVVVPGRCEGRGSVPEEVVRRRCRGVGLASGESRAGGLCRRRTITPSGNPEEA